jgi:hypothetical protein
MLTDTREGVTMNDKDTKASANAHPIRKALGKVAELQAEKAAIEHEVGNVRGVAGAKAKAAVANAKVVIAEKKREIEKRIDDARVAAHNKQ